jgi:aromatic-L-amino-acid decarboxylase
VCIRHEPEGLSGEPLDDYTRAWADQINRSGEAYVTPAIIGGRWTVRASIGALSTEEADVEAMWEIIQRRAAQALAARRA